MKQFVVLIAIIFAAFFLANNWLDKNDLRLPDRIEQTTEQGTLPMKIAYLAAREPEARIKIPVEGVRVRQVADTWGAPRGGERAHQGQDIFARRGTPVRSAAEGYVVRVGESTLGGKIVFVAGAGGRFYYYAHLDAHAENLKIGDFVTPETVLGFVGNTGNAKGTPPHLHFGVYTSSGAINPLPLLTDQV